MKRSPIVREDGYKTTRLSRRNRIVAQVKRELDARFPAVTPANVTAALLFVQRRCRELRLQSGAR